VVGGVNCITLPVVQYDVKADKRKVIAFLHPFFKTRYGYTPIGTFSSAIDPRGDRLYITWHGRRREKGWDTCALMAIQVPEEERRP
jgi:hypothetical protein